MTKLNLKKPFVTAVVFSAGVSSGIVAFSLFFSGAEVPTAATGEIVERGYALYP